MELNSGSRLGPYEIVSRIGAGGMGEVWRARDTRLDRSVAIKVLPEKFANSAQLKGRFEREARTISQLNHPHICTLYDVGENYLVMELLEGESLAERLKRGPLPLNDALRYGAQIADALERAHRAGVVHRDLKPGNVMITKSGAKLLDFGLAKTGTVKLSHDAPTIQNPLTQEGAILGTFQYMAPEQLEAQEVDGRADIFALGAVLYEMITGRRAFEGKTTTSLIAAIVTSSPPPMSQIQELTPPALDHVVAKCLEKDPDNRWQSVHDVAEELRWIATGSGMATSAPVPRRQSALYAVITAVALVAIAATALFLRDRLEPREPVSFAIMPPHGYWLRLPVLSPDGRILVFSVGNASGERSLWLRPVSKIEGHTILKRTDGSWLQNPFWSADGKWIAFWQPNEQLMKISVSGGEPQLISRKAGYGLGGTWSEHGTILFAPRFSEGLFSVAASGGEPVAVTRLDTKRREAVHAWPQFLADGEHFLFLVRTVADEKNEIHAGSLREGRKGMVTKADSLVGVHDGSLLFVRDGAMYAQRFDAGDLRVSGEPHKILDGIWYSADILHAGAAVSKNGQIAYLPASNAARKHTAGWYDRGGRKTEHLFDDVAISEAVLSPDETRVAVAKRNLAKGADDIHVVDLARGVSTKITGGLSHHFRVVWSPAGDRLFFTSDRSGVYDVYAQADDGATPAEVIWKSSLDKNVSAISPDAKILLGTETDPKTGVDIWVIPTESGQKPRPLLATEANELLPIFSPDGKWLVYECDQSGRQEIYVRGFPTGRSVQVSIGGGEFPQWKYDGSEIFYVSGDRNMISVPFQFDGSTARPGKPAVLFPVPRFMELPVAGRRTDRFFAYELTDPTESVTVAHYISDWKALGQ